MTEAGTPLIVKRYAGQRLYDPAAGAYLTLDDLAQRSRTTRTSSSPRPRPARTSRGRCSNRSLSSVGAMAKSDGTGHDQEIRQPAALQHRHQHLCDARRPRRHGEGGRGLRRLRRQDRRGHHPLGAGADHLRAGEQGRAEPAADQLPAPAHPLLRRLHADAGAALSRSLDRVADARAGEVPRSRWRRRSAPARSGARPARGPGAAEHGDVRARLRDVHAVRQREAQQAEADAAGARQPAPAAAAEPTRSTISSARWKRCRSGSTASATRTTADGVSIDSDEPSAGLGRRVSRLAQRGDARPTAAPSVASPTSAPCR